MLSEFYLEVDNERLWRAEREIPLTPKAFALLRYLVEHPQQLLRKETLLEAVWPDTLVVENVLKNRIQELRGALGDDVQAPRYIETVRGRGYRWIGAIALKGAAPQPARAPSTPSTPSTAPLGRATEFDRLRQGLAAALGGTRQVVLVSGEAGIGKTTLVQALLTSVRDRAELRLACGQCVEHRGQGEPYLPFLQVLDELCRGPGGAKVVACLQQYAPLWLLQLPGLLEAGALAEVERRTQGSSSTRMPRELAQTLEVLAAEQGLILWLDDLHWADAATLELIDYLARQSRPARLLLVGAYRPLGGLEPGHALVRLQAELSLHGRCRELALGPLDQAAIAQYLSGRLGEVGAQVAAPLHRHSGGNPLFLITLVAQWQAQGVLVQDRERWQLHEAIEPLQLAIPPTLRGLIEQQLAHYAESDQQLLEVAAAVGMEFSAAALAAGLEQALEAVEGRCAVLARRGPFLRASGQERWPDGTVAGHYSFQHALYRDALYARVTPARRQRLHRAIGERLEQGFAEASESIAADLARHFEQNGDYARAVRYWSEAAEVALRRYAGAVASHSLQQALALLQHLPPSAARERQELKLLLRLGSVVLALKGYTGAEVQTAYARALALAEQVGEPAQRFEARRGLWMFHFNSAQFARALELAQQLLALAAGEADSIYHLEAHRVLGATLLFLGQLNPARAHLEQSLAWYDPEQHTDHALRFGFDLRLACLNYLALSLWFLGHPEQALARSQQALTLARQLSHPFTLSHTLAMSALLHTLRREAALTQQRAEELLALASEQVFTLWRGVGAVLHGWALAEQGQPEANLAELQRGADVQALARPYWLGLLAQLHARKGRCEQGLNVLAKALTPAIAAGEGFYAAELHRLQGELLLGQGTPEAPTRAETCFQHALAIARGQGARAWELRAAVSLSKLWVAQGKSPEARALLAPVYSGFSEGFETADLQEAKGLLEELSVKRMA